MQPRVTAILVARNGAAFLERTLEGLSLQTRRPDIVLAVDAASTDGSAELLAASGPTQLITTAGKVTFGGAIARALHVASAPPSSDEWLWLLAHDSAPHPLALEELLGAVEIAPSVAIAGPKLMRWDDPDVIADFGEAVTRFGASIPLVDGELDQAQHDAHTDVLGVASHGMLVRRSVWTALGGFDPGLPAVDAGLDFSIRTRLAGFRVSLVPGARVATAGGPELFGRRSISEGKRARLGRAAQLHRRMVYAPAGALLFHWLSLVPLALVRAIGQLLAKRPGAVGGEFSTAIATAFGGSGIGQARRNLRRTRKLGWDSIAPLRLPWSEVREHRAQQRERERGTAVQREARAGFISHGGLWIVVFAAIVGLVSYGSLLGGAALTGGGLLPLSSHVGDLWTNLGVGWREIGTGFTGAADPFAYLLAVLGSLTFWAPSFSIVLLWVLALPLAALGAWFCARRIAQRSWVPAIAALLWAFAPTLLGSLEGGHIGAVIAHILLPWLVLAGLSATRSWASAAGAAILFSAVTASAPSLAPALLLCWIVWVFSRPRSAHRLAWIPIPAAVLFAPLVVQQLARGNVLGLLADPGVPAAGGSSSGWHLALGAPAAGLHGWQALLAGTSLPASGAIVVVAVLLAPLGVLALLSMFVPGSRRSIPSMSVALLGFVTAVAVSHISVSELGTQAVVVWPGAGLSLYWLGLLGGLIVALDALRRVAVPLAVVTAVAATALVVPLLAAFSAGAADVRAGSGRILPAVVTAGAEAHPTVATLVIGPQASGGISVELQRGEGTTLDDQSTLHATRTRLSAVDARVAKLAGNLASRSGYDPAKDLTELGIGFVVLTPSATDDAVHQRISEALDSNSLLDSVGITDNGLLWRYQGLDTVHPAVLPPAVNGIGVTVLIVQAIVFGFALLLGIPTSRRRRTVALGGSAKARRTGAQPAVPEAPTELLVEEAPAEPAKTFDRDEDDDVR
jgi:GT2 family glycosyltransferase